MQDFATVSDFDGTDVEFIDDTVEHTEPDDTTDCQTSSDSPTTSLKKKDKLVAGSMSTNGQPNSTCQTEKKKSSVKQEVVVIILSLRKEILQAYHRTSIKYVQYPSKAVQTQRRKLSAPSTVCYQE